MLLPHAVSVTTPPTATPVTLAEAKAHLVVQHAADDALLTALLAVATQHAEREANLYLMPQVVEIGFAAPPGYGAYGGLGWWPPHVAPAANWAGGNAAVDLPAWPLRAVVGVQYMDANGVAQTWATDQYQTWLAHRPPLLAAAYGRPWPITRAGALRPLWVTCAVGAASAAEVPEAAKHAIKLIVAHAYANKGDGRDPTGETGLPPAAKRFLDYLREDYYR